MVIAIASMLLALGSRPAEPPRVAAVARVASPTAVQATLYVLASGVGTPPTVGAEQVWLVQRGAVSGEQRATASAFPLGFALAQRGALAVLNADGARIVDLDPGRAAFLPSGGSGSFASVNGDLALYVQIALVPVSAVPAALPPETIASAAFLASGGQTLELELVRGFLNPGHVATLPAVDMPALLVASDNVLHIEPAAGAPLHLARDDIALLAEAATVRNDGQQLATFVVARAVPAPRAAASAPQPLDPALDDAWRRNGCHLNPGNAACVTVGVAAACATTPDALDCGIDSDGDSCTDIAEVRAGFDAFDPADCIAGGEGAPAINCLFLTQDIACDGSRAPATDEIECIAAREIRLRRNPTSLHGCEPEVTG